MVSLPVLNQAGQQVGTYELDLNEIAGGVNKQLLHDVVVMYEASKRVGTARSRSRGEIVGSTKKLYKQKGTGRARMGPKRTPIRRGGGHAFAKVPRDWSYRLPRKAIQLATRMALLSKFQDDQVTLVDTWDVTVPKTKTVVNALKALKVADRTCLLAVDTHSPILVKSARNIQEVSVSTAADLNAYDLLHQRQLVLTKGALDQLRKTSGTAAVAAE